MRYNIENKPLRVAQYLRISTTNKDQKIDSQAHALTEYCRAKGYEVFKRYEDLGISGSKESRPQLNQMMQDARERKFDIVIVAAFDRFARSTKHLLQALEEFKRMGIGFVSVRESIDTNTAMGEAVLTILGALGQLERSTIIDRIRNGLHAARLSGKRLGRRPNPIDPRIIALREGGLSIREIAGVVGKSKSTIHEALVREKFRSVEFKALSRQSND